MTNLYLFIVTVIIILFCIADNDELARQQFIQEILVMKQLERHENILHMVGCITSAQPVCLVMEYADNGDLLTFLLSQRQLRLPVSYLPLI